jgi:hypothetical protein
VGIKERYPLAPADVLNRHALGERALAGSRKADDIYARGAKVVVDCLRLPEESLDDEIGVAAFSGQFGYRNKPPAFTSDFYKRRYQNPTSHPVDDGC